MKLSEHWLREWVNPRLNTKRLAECLTRAGIEVGAIEPVAPPLDRVVVGEVLSVTAHPNAERLRVCQVNVGDKLPRTVVCGAANAAAGLKVPVALPGATLPGDKTITETDLRGIKSSGMLCSAQDLGLEESSEGLLILDANSKPGTALVKLLGLDDKVFDIELTPNRGDCLSVAGLAREVAALTGAALTPPKSRRVVGKSRKRVKVMLEAPADCPVYIGRVIENIDPRVTTPVWMKERLRRAGQRSIHPVVDVTNYVMLEFGQPMHAFDLDKLAGAVCVRHARKGESLTLLDGRRITPEAGSLLIADGKKPLALAGIMGGFDSAVGADTRNLFLESAHFRPEAIAGRARGLGLQTESSQRFERGVDPLLPHIAMARATELLLSIVGGRVAPAVERTSVRHLPKPSPIALRAARIARVLGLRLPARDVSAMLVRLGMKVRPAVDGWRVTPPSYRFDVQREVDLIEELARVHGYEKLPATRPRLEMRASPQPESRLSHARLRTALVDRDYREVITYSFVDLPTQRLLDPSHEPLTIANPISADMAVMRTGLWPGLLHAMRYNQNRQAERLRLFEIGRRFVATKGQVTQDWMLAGAVCGSAAPPQWGMPVRAVDIFDVKADIEALIALSGRSQDWQFRPAEHPALHPGMTAEILFNGSRAGWMGLLRPELADRLSLTQPAVVFEVTCASLEQGQLPSYRDISRFPAIRRDLAITVNESVSAARLLDCARHAAGKLLVDLELFDEYRGKGIDSGRKSIALSLTLQDSSRTLMDEEVEELLKRVLGQLQSELGAILRQ
jgi:phenylalanyl-tRNA synthetase beta chain